MRTVPAPPVPAASGPGRARRARSLCAASLLVLVAACGDGDDGAPASPTAVGGATENQPGAPAPAPAPGAAPAPVAPVAPAPPDPAWLTESSAVAALTKADVAAAAASRGWTAPAGPPRCDVVLHAILHPTAGPKGEPTTASGAVLVPGGADCPGPFPVLSYSRGTDLDRARTLARADDRETQALAAFFATRGYVVVASDYLGYARSSFPYHPYLHAESEARTTIDALRAARTLLARLGVATTPKLFVTGYSQGGHAALATQRAIERDRPDGLAVTASGAMSGPYDLVGSFGEVARLLPLLLLDFGDSGTGASIVRRLGDTLGTGATELLAQSDRLRETLQANTVTGWRPLAPVMLCGGARDPVVPFSNTITAAQDFASRGATVTTVDVDAEPAFAPLLPPPGASIASLGSYHQGGVPPACFAAVRDRQFEPLR